MSHTAEYFYEVTLKDGSKTMRKHKKILKHHKSTEEEIAEMQHLYDIGITPKYICKKFNISLYRLKKLINLKVKPAYPGNISFILKRRNSI